MPEMRATSAEQFTEDQDPLSIPSDGYGPTNPVSGIRPGEPLDSEAEVNELVAEAEGAEEETLESTETPQPKAPANQPEDFELSKKAAMLDWIMQNPDRFIQMSQSKEKPSDPAESFLNEPPLPQDPDALDDRQIFELMVDRKLREILKPVLPRMLNDVNELKQFQGTVENALMRVAAGPDGKPLHPRWDELQGHIGEIRSKYPGMTPDEAYVLADRRVPSAHIVEAPQRPTPPVPRPRPVTPEQTRAATLSTFGRSSQATKPTPTDLRGAVEAALNEVGITE